METGRSSGTPWRCPARNPAPRPPNSARTRKPGARARPQAEGALTFLIRNGQAGRRSRPRAASGRCYRVPAARPLPVLGTPGARVRPRAGLDLPWRFSLIESETRFGPAVERAPQAAIEDDNKGAHDGDPKHDPLEIT